jgi:hypothetical protein
VVTIAAEAPTRIRRLLVRGGRKYRLVGVAEDGSGLYRYRRLGRDDFWIRTADGSEQPWNYLTRFGRKRPLLPPSGDRWTRPRRTA